MIKKCLSLFVVIIFFSATCEYVKGESIATVIETMHAWLSATDEEAVDSDNLLLAVEMLQCSGMFSEEPSDEADEFLQSAEVFFYYRDNVPYCSIDYNGFSGMIYNAPVVKADEKGWLIKSQPVGKFFDQDFQFTFLISEEKLYVNWYDGGGPESGELVSEYILNRNTTKVEDVPFVETSEYLKIQELVDVIFSSQGFDHTITYDEDTKEMTVYAALGLENAKKYFRDKPMDLQEKLNELLEKWLEISDDMHNLLTLSTKEGVYDFSDSRFTAVLVNELKESGRYYPQDIIVIVSNNEILYDCMQD